ncbi:MAG: flagellar basal body-associated FliL family protein [Pseudobdellovibrionaceae bacterium]
MAEEKAPAVEPASSGGESKAQRPTLFIILAIVNMLIVAGVGVMFYLGKKKEADHNTIQKVVDGEHSTQVKEEEAKKQDGFVGKMIPMETFLVNLAGSKGRRVAKVNMEFEVEGDRIAEEVEVRKAQVRDIIIILLSSKTFEEVSVKEGRDSLRAEIKDTVNGFLTSGKIKNVYFTEFIYN